MPNLRYRQRRRLMQENYQEIWEASQRVPEDPGIRENYHDLPKAPVQLVCCALGKAVNQGGILRLAEAYRIEKVTYEPEHDRAQDFNGMRGAKRWQEYEWGDPLTTIQQLKEQGHRVYGLSLDDRAVPLRKVEWSFPATIVLGHELKGLPQPVAEACDEIVAIPLYGITISLNVGMAAAIALEHALHAYQQQTPDFHPARTASQKLLDP